MEKAIIKKTPLKVRIKIKIELTEIEVKIGQTYSGSRRINVQSYKIWCISKVKSNGLRIDRPYELNPNSKTKKGNLCNENDLTGS